MERDKMKRCSKCLLPETYPNIRYNEGGVCNYCLSYTPIEYEGETRLEEFLNGYRNKGDKYDALVAVSGGRDSTFTLCELVEKYGMNVLAYNYDNGLGSPLGKTNLSSALEALDMDLVTFKHDQTKYFKNNLRALLRRFSPAMVPTLCLGCRYGIVGGAFKIAKKHHIPLVIFSSSHLEKSHFKNEFFKMKHNKKILGMFAEAINNKSYFRPQFIPMYIKDYFHDDSHVHPLSPVLKFLYGKVHIIEYFDFIEWDEEKIINTITAKVGWKKKKGEKSSWHLDCLVHPLKDYFYLKSVGFTERDDLLSNLIQENVIERETAFKKLLDEYDNKMENIEDNVLEIGEEIGLEKSVLKKLKNFGEFGYK